MNTLIGLVIFALASKEIVGQVEVFYRCKKYLNGNWEMKAFIRGAVSNLDVRAVKVETGVLTPLNFCSNSPLILTFNINPVQEVAPEFNMLTMTIAVDETLQIGVPDCGYARPFGVEGLLANQFQWKLNIGTEDVDPAFRLFYETTYSLFCDYDNSSMVQGELYAGQVSVTSPIAPTIVSLSENARMSVVDASTLNELSIVTFGKLINLRAELITVNVPIQNPESTGVSPHSCFACDNSLCTGNSFQITDSDGCVTGNSPFNVGFTGDGVTLYTGSFEMFSFSLSLQIEATSLAMSCSFDFCTAATGLSMCMDRCAHFTGRRKKRDVDGGTLNMTDPNDRLTIYIKGIPKVMDRNYEPIQGEFRDKGQGQQQQQQQGETEAIKCYESTGFITAVCILSAVLFLAILTSICLCLRLSNLRRKKESIYTSSTNVSESSGKGNSTYMNN